VSAHFANQAAGTETPRRLCVYNGGFLTQPRIKRILALAGWQVRVGLPRDGDWVGVWGQSPTAPRGERVAAHTDAPVLRVEDAFLRSVRPARAGGGAGVGLLIDTSGVHFDPSVPSDLERLLTTHPLDDTTLLNRAREAESWLRASHLSKYNAFNPADEGPEPGYVLVIDQTRGDASIRASGASEATFKEMLVFAQEENPGARILIKAHPETAAGQREGHYTDADLGSRIRFAPNDTSPWTLLEGATTVYTVSSQLGFEAIYAGHMPNVFGQPFYAGWGLTEDRAPANATTSRRQRRLTRAQLFAAAMILYPIWYDPYHDRLCELEEVIAGLEARARAWREDRSGWHAAGMRPWKRRPLQKVFGHVKPVHFGKSVGQRPTMVWASRSNEAPAAQVRVEDGFLRSRGLGADLVPPLSLVLDDLGIYYEPTKPSRLDRHIEARTRLTASQERRASALRDQICGAGVSKYNLTDGEGRFRDLPQGHRILVPGQVEDDASIQLGTGRIATNRALLEAVRTENPDAILIYKPHPDVVAGLRAGHVDHDWLDQNEIIIAQHPDPVQWIERVDAVWTMTSLLGFEALLRGRAVTCLGTPFYAGWGLTTDAGPRAPHRNAKASLETLIHAALIDYPRYFDPKTGLPCPPEIAVSRLATGDIPRPSRANRALAKLQGWMAGYAYLWR